ncbi:hypothetical protein L208DRAFT_840211 [Tricholoma matsutake]|nr:hypothetical protein L208DRAFT_840211 [Tricholoma matsutake 945]
MTNQHSHVTNDDASSSSIITNHHHHHLTTTPPSSVPLLPLPPEHPTAMGPMPAHDEMGPNNSITVWAPGEFFLFSFLMFSLS